MARLTPKLAARNLRVSRSYGATAGTPERRLARLRGVRVDTARVRIFVRYCRVNYVKGEV